MAYNAELQMLRELVWLLLGHCQTGQVVCIFCGERLLRGIPNMTFGHRRHTKITTQLAVHHHDENRDNNGINNLSIVHSDCHKRHHKEKRDAEKGRTQTEESGQ